MLAYHRAVGEMLSQSCSPAPARTASCLALPRGYEHFRQPVTVVSWAGKDVDQRARRLRVILLGAGGTTLVVWYSSRQEIPCAQL